MSGELIDILGLLKAKAWIDLTHVFSETSPRAAVFPVPQSRTLYDHASDGFSAQEFSFAGQCGTHIDAPRHFVANGRHVHELDLQELVLPLYVIDCSKQVRANPNFELSRDEVFRFENRYGPIEPNTFVAMRSDWSKRWPSQEEMVNEDEHGISQTPGWGMDALRYLFEERHVTAIGHETLDTDPGKRIAQTGRYDAELYVLRQNSYQIELMTNLDKLPAQGAILFNIVAKPRDASGFPVRAFAIVP